MSSRKTEQAGQTKEKKAKKVVDKEAVM